MARRMVVTLIAGLALAIGTALVARAQTAGEASLAVSFAEAPATAGPGQALSYRLRVSNSGPSAAGGVQLRFFPAPGTLVDGRAINASQGSCALGGDRASPQVSCGLGSIAAGASASVTIRAGLSDPRPRLAVASAHARADQRDPEFADNAPVATTRVLGANLALTGTAAPAGPELVYSLQVRNAGPGTAAASRLDLSWPEGFELGNFDPGKALCEPSLNTLSCELGDLASGATSPVALRLLPPAGYRGPARLAGAVSSASGDSAPADNALELEAPVGVADLRLQIARAPAAAGRLGLSLTLANAGPSAATGLRLRLPLPAGASLATAPATAGCQEGGGAVICALDPLAAGGSASLGLEIAGASGLAVVSAAVEADQRDPEPSDNAPALAAVVSGADLAVTASGAPAALRPGFRATYRFTVSNSGPAAAGATRLAGYLGAQVRLVSLQASQGSCAPAAGGFSCALGSVGVGGSATVTAVVTVGGPNNRVAVTSVYATSDALDPERSNNAPSVETLVETRFIFMPMIRR